MQNLESSARQHCPLDDDIPRDFFTVRYQNPRVITTDLDHPKCQGLSVCLSIDGVRDGRHPSIASNDGYVCVRVCRWSVRVFPQ